MVPDDFDGGVDSDTNSDANSDEEPVTAVNMEARSRTLDARAKRDAELDLGINQADDDVMDEDDEEGGSRDVVTFDLPTAEEREEEKKRGGGDLHEVQRRIQDCVRVLSDFKILAATDRLARTANYLSHQPHFPSRRSRSEYIEQLLSDICTYYGYNAFLAEKLFNLFPAAEVSTSEDGIRPRSPIWLSQAIEFFEANEVQRPVTIRTNTLKTRRRDLAQTLINRGVNLEPIGKWTNVGLQVFESTVPIGRS